VHAGKSPNRCSRRLAPCYGEGERKTALAAQGIDLQGVIDLAAHLVPMPREQIVGSGKSADQVKLRCLICCWETTQPGLTTTGVANALRISVPTASVAAKKGEQIALEEGCSLMDLLNIKT